MTPSRSSTSRPSRRASPRALRARLDRGAGALPVHPRAGGGGAGGRLAAFCGAAHCVAVSSGTDAIQIALMAEGIGRGDAVFLPAFTYTATAEVPLVLGATPVFVRCRSAHVPDRSGAASHARIAEVRARRAAAAAGADRRGSVRPAGGLARPAGDRRARGPVHARRSARRASAHAARAAARAPRPTRPRPASSPPSRSAPMATAARCSPRVPNAPRCIAACARTARARPATRCCAPA